MARPVTNQSMDAAGPATTAIAAPGSGAVGTSTLSFGEIYRAHFDFVWRNVRRLGVDDSRIDDAVQDVFIAVHRRLGDFQGRSTIKTWLFQFVLKVASKHRRATRRWWRPFAHADDEVPHVPADPGAAPDARLHTQQATALMYRLLGELSEDRRAVLVLSDLEELTMPEIAEALQLNVNTAYARLRAARKEFGDAVKRERARGRREDP
jgi:RNA polymerase sigma-70 factor (ECF subfamily)